MGEARLASVEGVVAVRPGWIDRVEVVEVHFDPQRIAYEDLVKRADEAKCTVRVFTRDDAQQETAQRLVAERAVRSDASVRTDDDKYYLSRTPLRFVPMTPLQAARV